jgi:Na+/H+ antiporter NhaD/arsenite permease-like protein
MAPLVMRVSKQFAQRATPYLLALATASNIGSTATITGNPQNILIGSVSRISYLNFLAHLGPVAVIGLFLDWAVLHLLYFRSAPWLERPQNPAATFNRPQTHLVFPASVALCVLAGFLVGLPPALVAAVGAAVLLVHPRYPSKFVYDEVDWSLLVFFIGLFLIVGGAEQSGIAQRLLSLAEVFNLHNRWIFSGVVVALSNIVSNVPAVMLLKGLLPNFGDPHHFWLLLAMTSTLAGNLTITGSVANIIVVEKARADSPVTFREYLKAGVPVTVATVIVGTIWLSYF